jgi:hypothetical protein
MIAVMLTSRENDKDISIWLSDFSVDFEKIFEVIEMILNMYKLVKSYDEKIHIEALLKRLPRPSTHSQPSSIHSSHSMKLKWS